MASGMCHEKAHQGSTNEWYTPRKLIEPLGSFDLDPCAPSVNHWTAAKCLTKVTDGLSVPWSGRVWLNPPYGPETTFWIQRLADHGRGTALVFARTETEWFYSQVWQRATALLFLKGRVKFLRQDGTAGMNAAAPSVLIAYGADDADILSNCEIPGGFVRLNH